MNIPATDELAHYALGIVEVSPVRFVPHRTLRA